ncbi:MAG: AMP-dependent synthetase/ligase [Nocardiaceae bacterium]|nr:AMP-dependent synthetase/ligase [Nocardiaceae bacterium]
MREFEVPASYTIPDDASMADNVFRFAVEDPTFVPFKISNGSGGWYDVTAAAFAKDVTAVAKGLMASGVEPGDRVALLSSTRYEWTLIDFAIWAAGGCTVSIYDSSAADQCKWILENSGTKLLIVETPRHAATVDEVAKNAPDLDEVLQINAGAIDELKRRGASVSDEELEARRRTVNAKSPATLIYTSGTTGRPKGVLLTHSNLYAESMSARIALKEALVKGKKTLMFLPLAHVFARAISVGAFDGKVTVAHTSDWATLVEQFGAFQPDFILSVPRVFEKVFNSAKQKAHDGGKGKIFDAAAATAIAYSEAIEAGGPSLGLKIKHAVFDKLVYGKLKAALGGHCERAVSGGGPLGARLGHFFRGVGIPIYEGYGLTETSAAVTVNTQSHIRVGSVGRPIEGCGAKVADDGELLLKGGPVFSEYWKNPDATAESFEDGWFKTGDLGKIDDDGFVFITGRKKELIVTAAGKNVSPASLEDPLRAHPLIGQPMIVGDNRPFVGVLVTLDPEALPGWKQRNNIDASTSIEELTTNPALLAELESAVADANSKVSKAEQIKKIKVLSVEWTQETGELTPKMSLKRAVVMKQHEADIEALYS